MIAAIRQATLVLTFGSLVLVQGAAAQGMQMNLLGIAGEEKTEAMPAGSWQHSREYTTDEGGDGAPVLTVVRMEWNDRAEDGIDITVTEQAGAGNRITKVEYFLQRYDVSAADQINVASATNTDAGSRYRYHITLPNSAGKRFVDPPEDQTDRDTYGLSVHAHLKSTKWGIDVESALGIKVSAKFFNLPLRK